MSHAAVFSALTATLISASPLAAEDRARDIPGVETTPMSAKDLITTPRLGGPIVSPDGKRAIYRVTETDPDSLERSAKYFLINLEKTELPASELRMEMEGAHSLQWVGAGHIYFIATDESGEFAEYVSDTQIYTARVKDDGTVEDTILASSFKVAPDGFKISPEEDKIAVWANLPRDCANLRCEVPDATETKVGSGRLYEGDAGFFRHWDRWTKPGHFNRVFAHDIDNEMVISESGIPVDGIDPAAGITANTPTMPFGGSEDISWAADGKGLYFVARETGREEPLSTDLDIYFSDLSGSAPVELTAGNPAVDTTPAPSPDGKYLAYLAMERPGYEADRLVIHIRDLESGETRALTQDFDRSFGGLSWTADGSAILATAADVLDTPVFRVDPQTGAVTRLDLMAGNEAHIGNVTALAGDRLLFTRDSIGVPSELYLSDGYKQARPLTDIATTRMGTMASTVTTRFSFPGANGETVWGQITRLEEQTGSIPAILYIHGGPQGSFRDGWSSRWNPRVVASQGYAVISVDFHGSAGYGQDFMDAINQDWGGKPLEDLQLGLAAALKLDRQIDGGRTCAMGASYGGYMVNWIAGKWPERFNCLVQHDGLFDMRSFYYSTEELWFPRWDFGGSYSEARETYERWNPVNHVDNWQTPMLVIAGERDFRVPYTQGLQSFTALQERNIPSQLLVFPDENHWVLGAENSLQWHNTVFDWLDLWLVQEIESASD